MVIGSYVTLNIYRLGGGDPAVPTADVGELPPGTSRERTSRKERIKALLGPGAWLAIRCIRSRPDVALR